MTLAFDPGCRETLRILVLGMSLACAPASAREDGVVIEWLDAAEGAYSLRGTIATKAPSAAIWGALTDYGRFPEIFPDVARVDARESGPRGATVVIYVENVWTKYDYETRRDYVEPGKRISWRMVRGPYKSMNGEWLIHEPPGSAVRQIVCTTTVELESSFRAAMARPFAASGMRNALLRIRERLESAGQ